MIICYFGIYNPNESRNKIYIDGLRQNGVKILECRDIHRGPLKYIFLFFKHWKIRDKYDLMIVGYPGHVVVPFARLISRKRVVLDALCSLYEGVIISRGKNGLFSLREKYGLSLLCSKAKELLRMSLPVVNARSTRSGLYFQIFCICKYSCAVPKPETPKFRISMFVPCNCLQEF